MPSVYEEYRTSEEQFMRYREAIISFMQAPEKTKFIPAEGAPATTEVDLRALFQDMVIEPEKYVALGLNFPLADIQNVYRIYVFKHDHEGVFMSKRQRRVRNTFRPKRDPRFPEFKSPVIAVVENPSLTVLTPAQMGLIQDGLVEAKYAPSNKLSMRHVNNPKAVITACRAIEFQMFDAPIEFQGVMTDEQIELYSSKFPTIEFIPRDSTTLLL